MRRYASLWAELFGMSWRHERGRTVAALASIALSVVLVAACALTLRQAVNATAAGDLAVALIGAVGAAVSYGLTLAVQDMANSSVATTADRVGRLRLHSEIHRDIASLERLEHLERSDFHDRVAIVRASSGDIPLWQWQVLLVCSAMVQLLITLLLLGMVSPWLLLLLPFAALPIWFDHIGQRAVTRAEIASAEDYRLQQHLFGVMTSASGGKEVRISGTGEKLGKKQRQVWDDAMIRRFRAQLTASCWRFAGWSLFAVCFVLGLGLSAYRTLRGDGTIGDLVFTVTIASTLRQTITAAVSSTVRTAGAARFLDPYLWLRDYSAAERAATVGVLPSPEELREGISLENVSYTYPGQTAPVLRDVTLRLPAGRVVAIVGEYGSGKSTLVKLLAKFYRPDSGRITVDGTDLAALDTAGWRSRSTAVFQDFGQFHTTVAEAVGLGDLSRLDDRERITEALRTANAEDLVAKLPNGLDTQLGTALGGVDLSGGQWQRTALARASMRDRPLLFVLDEPTASLDAPSEQEIFTRYMAHAKRLAKRTGAITVVVSHRFSTVADADLIVVLERGRIVEHGTHGALVGHGGVYAELYGMQSAAYADF
ncbi:MAG TPA: ABC transporter ATP-binding protein [Umezawaea sp.]|nr:ABC transporter ATP-binding protein [Umezawaea sp.]